MHRGINRRCEADLTLSSLLHSPAKGLSLFPRFKGTTSQKEQICFHVKREIILKLSLKYSSIHHCDVQSIIFKRFDNDPVLFMHTDFMF